MTLAGRAKWMDWWKSRSIMKGHEMYWELTIFQHVPHIDCGTWFDIELRTESSGDHSPSFRFNLMLFNWTIFEFEISNGFHEVDVDDAGVSSWER